MLFQGHTLRLLDEAQEVGHHQHPGPQSQDSQQMLDQPRGSFPDLLEIQASGGCRKQQKTSDFPRKPKTFAETAGNCRMGVRHPRSITLSAALRGLTVLQRGGAAQRGAQFYFVFAALRTLSSCREMSLHPHEGNPLKGTP